MVIHALSFCQGVAIVMIGSTKHGKLSGLLAFLF
ncbi:Uncharacterised protein [Legionella israelensis]|nr:Uncharacterised protein [Legionella israelensis]